jgi:hypothetical protein
MGCDDVEVIIRDNSGNGQKREFLSHIHENNCRIIFADECSLAENQRHLLQEAKGDFVLVVADDGFANSHAMPSLLDKIEEIHDNSSIVGVTGVFIIDDTSRSRFVCFNKFNASTALERFQAFFKETNYSTFQHSPFRGHVLKDVWKFMSTLPAYLSYHDGLMNCLLLMNGQLSYVEQFIYQANNTDAATVDLRLKKDAQSYRKAGLDTSGVRLHWLIAAFEGAQTFNSKYLGTSLPQEQRRALGALWFAHCFPSFLETSHRQADNAKFDLQAMRIADKWRAAKEAKLPELLTDIAEYYALSSPDFARCYFDFWK